MRPNILIVVLDSVRAQNMGLYNHHRNTTPFLESFAEEAFVYNQARAPGMTSLPSHTSIFTGYHVEEHGVHDSILHKTKTGITVWDDLKEKGYTTGVFSDNVNLIGSNSSLRESFDMVSPRMKGIFPEASTATDFLERKDIESPRLTDYVKFVPWMVNQEHSVKTLVNGAAAHICKKTNSSRMEQAREPSYNRYLDLFFDWIDQQSGPWGACINLMDAHHPYFPNNRFDKWGGKKLQRKQSKLDPHPWRVHGGQIGYDDWKELENAYDGTIYQLDQAVKSLIHDLKERDIFDTTMVIITSDHGEGFGEKSRVRPDLRTVGHVAGLHECLLHVPLLVSYPEQTTGDSIDELATLTNFRKAVEAALDGSWNGTEFVPTSPVVASGTNIENKLKNTDRAAKYVDDTDVFAGVVRAVYKRERDQIKKYMTWGDESATVVVESAQKSYESTERDAKKEVDDVFNLFEDAKILVEREDSIDSSTASHLSDLGYL